MMKGSGLPLCSCRKSGHPFHLSIFISHDFLPSLLSLFLLSMSQEVYSFHRRQGSCGNTSLLGKIKENPFWQASLVNSQDWWTTPGTIYLRKGTLSCTKRSGRLTFKFSILGGMRRSMNCTVLQSFLTLARIKETQSPFVFALTNMHLS